MTSTSATSTQRLAPLAVTAVLFGALGPFANSTRAAIYYQLGRPVWPAICACVLACLAAIVCVRALSSNGGRVAMLVSVGMLVAPMLFVQWLPGLGVVGAIGATVLVPTFLVAIGLSQAKGANAVVSVAALVACGPLTWLLAARASALGSSVLHSLPLPHIALGLGAIALAGTAAVAWLLPWPTPEPVADPVAVPPRHAWLGVGSSLFLAGLASVDVDFLVRGSISGVALYLAQAVGLPIACALCLLPLSHRHRAGVYLAVAFGGRVLGVAAIMVVEWLWSPL
jgi:hypothetical protein